MRRDVAVLFDMDGVIFDSERAILGVWRELGQELALPEIDRIFRRCIGTNRARTEQIFREACPGLDFAAFDREAKARFRQRYGEGRLPQKPGARQILSTLQAREIPLALASSTERSTVVRELEEAGLLQFFRRVIGGDMVRRSKPDPEIFLTAAKELNVPPENCYVIEDSFNGIRAAHAAGMHPLMVPDLVPPDREMEELAEVIFTDLSWVTSYLLERL